MKLKMLPGEFFSDYQARRIRAGHRVVKRLRAELAVQYTARLTAERAVTMREIQLQEGHEVLEKLRAEVSRLQRIETIYVTDFLRMRQIFDASGKKVGYLV